MKRLLSYLLVVTVLTIGIGGVTRLVTYAAVGLPFNGWLQLSGGYAQVPYQDEIMLDPTNGSFTLEGWINNPHFNSMFVIYKKYSFGLSFAKYQNWPDPGSSRYDIVFSSCGISGTCAGLSHTLSQCSNFGSCQPVGWFHFAYVYNQVTNTGALFWNGSMLGSTESIPNTSTQPIKIQYANSMDEFRISNNVRYTASFTPASVPFECDANTGALWHFNEVSGSTIFHDACGAVDNMFVGYNGAHTEGVTGPKFYLPVVTK